MLVKRRLQINAIVPVITAIVIILVLFLALERVNDAVKQSNVAAEIVTVAFERNALRVDYLQTESERAQKQWFAKDKQYRSLLNSASENFRTAEDRKIIGELVKDDDATEKVFTTIVANRKKARVDAEVAALTPEAESRLVSQMRMKVYDRALNGRTLQASAKSRLSSTLGLGAVVIICVVLTAALAAMANSYSMGRIIADRMAKLREGASVIGAGNLDHRIDTYNDEDEFVDLSRSFNEMTVKLQSSYLELEKEISERRGAEKALQNLNDELEMRVAQRTEELNELLVKQEAQHAELQQAYGELEARTTERIEILEELRQKEKLLVEQSRLAAMGEMLLNISHQWRQPLNVLGLKIQELGLSYEYGAFSGELLNSNIENAMEIIQHMSQTIDDFKEFLSPNAERVSFSVDDVVAKTVGLIKQNFQQDRIGIDIVSEGSSHVHGYPNQFGQVLLNLFMNARDAFLDAGVRDARITVRSWAEKERTIVTVTDNAGGISDEIVDRIFDAYFTTKKLGKGVGVGLFMSKNIIEKNMGGRLSVSNVDGGAEFRIEV
jgi:C4-dicarboxylate-specific signal transduction histidine kinase